MRKKPHRLAYEGGLDGIVRDDSLRRGKSEYILAINLDTSGLKASLFDAGGSVTGG